MGLGPAADGAAPVRGHARRQHLPAVAPGQSAPEAAPAAQPAGRLPCPPSHVTHLGACQKEYSASGANIFLLSRLADLRRKLPLPHSLQVRGGSLGVLFANIWSTFWVKLNSACAVGAQSQLQPAAPGRGVLNLALAQAQNAPQQHCWHRRQASARRCRLLPMSHLLFMQSRLQAMIPWDCSL